MRFEANLRWYDFFNLTIIPDALIGQYFYYYSIDANTIWTNDKPHVIYGDVIVENGATFLSVLTEEDFFLGKLEYIKNIKKFNYLKI